MASIRENASSEVQGAAFSRFKQIVVLQSALILWAGCLLGQGVFLVPDPSSVAYDGYAVVAGGDIQIAGGAQVQGDIHANEDIDILPAGVVVGSATAAGLVPSPTGVTGSVTEAAPLIGLPALLTTGEAQSLADTVYTDDTEFPEDVEVDGVLFIAGDAVFLGAVNGSGTIIASEDIRLEESVGAGLNAETRISFVAFGDIWIDRGREMRGLFLAGDDLKVKRGASLEGVAIANGSVDLDPEVLLTFLAVDTSP